MYFEKSLNKKIINIHKNKIKICEILFSVKTYFPTLVFFSQKSLIVINFLQIYSEMNKL